MGSPSNHFQSLQQITRLLDAAPDIIYRYRLLPEPGFEYVSLAATAITGYTPDDHYVDPLLAHKILHPDDRWMWDRLVSDPEQIGGPLVLRCIRRDGKVIWMEQRNVLVRDEMGRGAAVEGVARDITESRRTAEELSRLSAAIEQAAEVAIITDPAGTILYVNPAFERITGYSRAEAVGSNPRMLKSGLQDEAFYLRMWELLARGEAFSGTMVNRRKDGTHYTAEAIISPVRNGDGALVNYVGLQRDVTRERELSEALRQSQKMESLGQLTGGIAHDFNNLLTVVLANAALAQAELPSGATTLRTYTTEIEVAARRGSAMVRKLLAFGRRERLSLSSIRLSDTIVEMARTLKRILPETIRIVVREGSVPLVMADPGSLEQMLLNLATNARDAMPAGGELVLAVSVADLDGDDTALLSGSGEAGRFVVLSVSDTGVGMDQATREKCFEPFFTTKPRGEGTGLGLPMVFGLVRQHGGFAQIYSERGQGTVVRLYFPESAATGLVAAGSQPRAVVRGGSETILLVEDEPSLRRAGLRVLERYGYRVMPVEDGQEALEAWKAHRESIALVLSDVVMPRMGGQELARELRRLDPRLPLVLTSGYAEREGEGLPGVKHVAKPWTGEELARAVREALDAAQPAASGA